VSRECVGLREVAPDLALGLLDGEARADALEHVHRCPSCQAVVAELAGVADLLVQLAPDAEPPPGFERRVLDATRHDRRARRRWVTAIAAVAAAAAIGAIAVVRMVDAGRPPERAAAGALHTTPMRGTGGVSVGRVVTTGGSPATAIITVDYAVADGDYDLVLRSASGAPHTIGTMTVHEGHGAWRGTIDTAGAGASLAMVDGQGTVVCHAALAS
jgi:predicted anti-sigma-YlaC factor YlaD